MFAEPKLKRTEVVWVRLTVKEEKRLKELAQAFHLSVSSYIRLLIPFEK